MSGVDFGGDDLEHSLHKYGNAGIDLLETRNEAYPKKNPPTVDYIQDSDGSLILEEQHTNCWLSSQVYVDAQEYR